MSTFCVKVCRIRDIEPIDGSDFIELAVIGDYRSVVKKGEFKKNQLAVYIPEASIVPQWILEEMNLVGKLAGSEKNRVKAIKLRGVLSQGLVYPLRQLKENTASMELSITNNSLVVREGDNVQQLLGIAKYEPSIPVSMAGEVYNAGTDITVAYDIENFKAFPDVLQPGEEVVMTEKLHGTFCGVGILPKKDWDDKHYRGKFVVFSKGLGGKGLCFKQSDNNAQNVYIRALESLKVFDALEGIVKMISEDGGVIDSPTFLLGEVFGRGVQDLSYGFNDPQFRIFDVAVGYRGDQRYYDYDDMITLCKYSGLQSVPLIYRGPFSRDVMLQHTSGFESVSGNKINIREGVVVKPVVERRVDELGRVILKSVSDDYLTRKNGTEYN